VSSVRIILRSFIFLFSIAAIFAQQPAPPAPVPAPVLEQSAKPAAATYQISGTLVDSTNNQPLAHARVAIAPVTDRAELTTVVTTEDGHFLFRRLAPGKYTLTAQRRGYLTQSFDQHDQFSSSIAVGEGHESRDLLFRLAPEAVISGNVTDEQGEAVPDAQVLLFRVGGNGEAGVHVSSRASTNDEGAFRFGHLVPGKYLVAVFAKPWYAQGTIAGVSGHATRVDGSTVTTLFGGAHPQESAENTPSPLDVAYLITFYPGATDASVATQITLARGEKSIADISLQPVPALHLRVKMDETGAAQYAPALEIHLFDTAVFVPAQTTVSTNDGMTLSGIAPGHYAVKARDPRNGQTTIGSEREIDVSQSGELPASQGPLHVPVTATLQADSGLPVQNQISIQLHNKRSGENVVERLNPKGEAEFTGVPPGTYEISIGGSTGAFLSSIASLQAKPVGRTLSIQGPAPVKIALTLSAGQARITGVALKEGKPFAGAMILLVPADAGHNHVLFRRDQSDTDGAFTLASVVPGKYTLLALENGWDLEWTKPSVLKPFLPQGEAVAAQVNGKLEIKLKVQ